MKNSKKSAKIEKSVTKAAQKATKAVEKQRIANLTPEQQKAEKKAAKAAEKQRNAVDKAAKKQQKAEAVAAKLEAKRLEVREMCSTLATHIGNHLEKGDIKYVAGVLKGLIKDTKPRKAKGKSDKK